MQINYRGRLVSRRVCDGKSKPASRSAGATEPFETRNKLTSINIAFAEHG